MVSTLGPCGFDTKSIGTLNNGISTSGDEQQMTKLHRDTPGSALTYCNTSPATPTSKKENTCEEDGEGCQCSRNSTYVTLQEVEACFCYSCRLIAREMVCIKL
jgi:hypothetical protein